MEEFGTKILFYQRQRKEPRTKMLQVDKTKQAKEDLYHIWHYISIVKQNPLNADAFIYQLDAAFGVIAKAPKIGSLKPEYLSNVRQYILGQYLIFYLVEDTAILIVRVIHGNQDLPSIFE